MKREKRYLSIILALALIFTMIPMQTVLADADDVHIKEIKITEIEEPVMGEIPDFTASIATDCGDSAYIEEIEWLDFAGPEDCQSWKYEFCYGVDDRPYPPFQKGRGYGVKIKIHPKKGYSLQKDRPIVTINGDDNNWVDLPEDPKDSSIIVYYAFGEPEKSVVKAKLIYTSTTYNGKTRRPYVFVTDEEGQPMVESAYSIIYGQGRKYVGKYSVKVDFKDPNIEDKTLYFKINPKGTYITKAIGDKKQLTVTWKKQSVQTTGYQLYIKRSGAAGKTYSLNSNTVKKVFRNLSSNKTYTVKIRTYKTVKGNKYYSEWSKTRTVRTR